MHPIISIVGRSNSGKTTLLEGLIAELKQRHYRVAIIKHSSEDFEIDTVNKDTWRFREAGSEISAISSTSKLTIFRRITHDLSPQELTRFIGWDYDLILTEGFKKASTLKIEIHNKEQGGELLSPPKHLLAVVTDEPLDVDVPQFTRDEIKKLADLIEDRLKTWPEEEVKLFVNDAFVPLNLFIKNFLTGTLLGMVSALKGIKEVKSLYISLRRKN